MDWGGNLPRSGGSGVGEYGLQDHQAFRSGTHSPVQGVRLDFGGDLRQLILLKTVSCRSGATEEAEGAESFYRIRVFLCWNVLV